MVRLVLCSICMTPSHDAIIPGAMHEPKHMANLVQGGLQRTVEQMCSLPSITPAMIAWYMSNETEHSDPQGQSSQPLDEFQIAIKEVAHSGTKQSESIGWDYRTKCFQDVP